MITPFQIYLFTRLDTLCGFFTIGATVLGVGLFAAFMVFGFDNYCEEDAGLVRSNWLQWGVGFFVLFLISALFTPSQKDVAMMYVVPAIANNHDVQALPGDVVKLARQQIEKYLSQEVTPIEKK